MNRFGMLVVCLPVLGDDAMVGMEWRNQITRMEDWHVWR
jgi:hypothetical protein